MATISKGILGGFSGKVGNIVGARWRNKDIIRSKPGPRSKPPTDKQLYQQMKFALVISFLQPLQDLQSRYFGSDRGSKSRTNLAVSYTITEAIEEVDGEPTLVYSKVLITKGELAGFQNVALDNQAGGILQLSWDDNSIQGNAMPTDMVNLVCYCADTNTFEPYLLLAQRSDGNATATLPEGYIGKEIQVWAFFNNEAQDRACNSPYLGAITLV
ncbi:DUF6266 family protein [Sinomicrobium sp. M5D2P9]